MDRKVVQDGFIVCLRIFCNLKGIFEVYASISHINITASYESANRFSEMPNVFILFTL